MISEEIQEKLVESIVKKVEKNNTFILKKIAENIKIIRDLTPTQAMQIAQTLKYGGSYNEIVQELSKLTKSNQKEIIEMFDKVAEKEYDFSKIYYDAKQIDFVPYKRNKALQRQVRAIARLTTSRYANIANSLGFSQIVDGKRVFTPLSKVYTDAIDEAVLNVIQGKETFDTMMFKKIKELGNSGIRTNLNGETLVEFENGYSRRLDSSIRMNMKDALRSLHNEIQQQIAEEIDADGVEISVHLNPAPDHAEVQGKQFAIAEFDKFQHDEKAVSYDGKVFEPEFEGHDRRSISELNCYHYIFSIVLGVNEPEYSNEQLKEIINNNEKGFEFENKHYSMYEGQQLQRKLETEIRKQKDLQIMGRASDNEQLIYESQQRITQLTNKYNELCNISGLKRKNDRLRVSGYKRIAIKK